MYRYVYPDQDPYSMSVRVEYDETPPAEKMILKVVADDDGRWSCFEISDFENGSRGQTIQQAIENFVEGMEEERAAKVSPYDDDFVYKIPYSWS